MQLARTSHTHTHLFSDPHVEVVEVRVAAIGLPAVLAAVMATSEHSDGVQRVGLTVVVANPCGTPEAGETSVSYPRPAIHPKIGGVGVEDEGEGGMKEAEMGKERKKCRFQSVRRGRKSRAEGVEM